MPHELGTQLVKDLVKMVARPSTTRADVNAILGAAGVGAPEDHLTRLPRDRVGVILPVGPEQGMALGAFTEAFGTPRNAMSIHGDEPPEVYWDVDMGKGEHVVLAAVLAEDHGADQGQRRVTTVRLTPYSL